MQRHDETEHDDTLNQLISDLVDLDNKLSDKYRLRGNEGYDLDVFTAIASKEHQIIYEGRDIINGVWVPEQTSAILGYYRLGNYNIIKSLRRSP